MKRHVLVFLSSWIIIYFLIYIAVYFLFFNFVDSATRPTGIFMITMGKIADIGVFILCMPSLPFVFLKIIPQLSYSANLGLTHWFIVYAGIDALLITFLTAFFDNKRRKPPS